MRKYQLTTEQFKEVIMPFLEEAKEATADNKVNFKGLKIIKSSIAPNEFNVWLDGTKRHGGYFVLFVDDKYRWCVYQDDKTPITDYLWEHTNEINKAIRAYLYEYYGDDYKDYIIKFFKEKQQEDLEHIKQERKRLEKELEDLEKELDSLDREEKYTKEHFDAEIRDIENLSNPHQV